MRLSDYVAQAAQAAHAAGPTRALASPGPSPRIDPRAELRSRLQRELVTRLGPALVELDEAALVATVQATLMDLVDAEALSLSNAERAALVDELVAHTLGLGPLEVFLADPGVSEIMVTGTGPIYVERAGQLVDTGARFTTHAALRQVIDRIVAKVGRRIDESSPMVDARLPDGSRVNAVVPPLSLDGPALTIRKFGTSLRGLDDLVAVGALPGPVAKFLATCVAARLNILVSGGTGSGKTTLLNALSEAVPATERIVTIEDAAELQLAQTHVVRLETRPANVEGAGHVTIRDLVRNALRMRPDRIIVGEVRGAETLDMLQAMNTGHDGSLSTLHANTPRDALARLETMVLMAGLELPLRAVREQVASAVDLLIHVSRRPDGSRAVTHITEVGRMEGEVITITDLFVARNGVLTATGLRPSFTTTCAERGHILPLEIFWSDDVARLA